MAAVNFIKNLAFDIYTKLKIVPKSGSFLDMSPFQFLSAVNPYQKIVAVNAGSYTINDQVTTLLLVPAGTIAGATVTMPANPYDGQIVTIASTQTITTLTHNANAGQTLNSALTTIGAARSTHGEWIWEAADATWYLL